jgi:hypothetical protein
MDNLPSIIHIGLKAVILLLLALYLLFSTLVYLNVRRMNTFVRISYLQLTHTIQLIYIIHLFLILSLFFLALVIL